MKFKIFHLKLSYENEINEFIKDKKVLHMQLGGVSIPMLALLYEDAPLTSSSTRKYKVKNKDVCCRLLKKLNECTGKSFRDVHNNLKHIDARLNEGYAAEDIAIVIDFCSNNKEYFAANPEYLRPETLFNATKFAGYLEEAKQYGRIG